MKQYQGACRRTTFLAHGMELSYKAWQAEQTTLLAPLPKADEVAIIDRIA